MKPEMVTKSMEEFSKPQYRVDVLKVEVPINANFVEGSAVFKGQKAYTREEALDHFRQGAAVAKKPFIYLSAGVSNAQFVESLNMAAEAGTDYLGRPVRPRDLEGRHADLRQAGREGAGRLAFDRRREEHQRRERRHQVRQAVVCEGGSAAAGARIKASDSPAQRSPHFSFSRSTSKKNIFGGRIRWTLCGELRHTT